MLITLLKCAFFEIMFSDNCNARDRARAMTAAKPSQFIAQKDDGWSTRLVVRLDLSLDMFQTILVCWHTISYLTLYFCCCPEYSRTGTYICLKILMTWISKTKIFILGADFSYNAKSS